MIINISHCGNHNTSSDWPIFPPTFQFELDIDHNIDIIIEKIYNTKYYNLDIGKVHLFVKWKHMKWIEMEYDKKLAYYDNLIKKNKNTVYICEDKDITLFVKNINGKLFELRTNQFNKVSTIKKQIQDYTDVPYDYQRLMYNGSGIDDNKILPQYGIFGFRPEIDLAIRARGGMHHKSSGHSDYDII